MNDLFNEPMGFKFTVVGFTTWLTSLMQGMDLTQVIGFVGLVIGLVIQLVSYYRNRKSDLRAKEADDRSRAQYDLQMIVLAKELLEIEQRLENGKRK